MCLPSLFTMHFSFLPCVKSPCTFSALCVTTEPSSLKELTPSRKDVAEILAVTTKQQKTDYIKEEVNENTIGYTLKPSDDAVPGGPAGS